MLVQVGAWFWRQWRVPGVLVFENCACSILPRGDWNRCQGCFTGVLAKMEPENRCLAVPAYWINNTPGLIETSRITHYSWGYNVLNDD